MAEVDSIKIHIGADTTEIDKAINFLLENLARLDDALKSMAKSATAGIDKIPDQPSIPDVKPNTISIPDVKPNKAVEKTKEIGKAAKETAGELDNLGKRWAGFVSGIVKQFAGPLIAAFSVGAVVSKYTGDVAKVAQMTGRYSTQMEEWKKKRELLSRINSEDIELYRKGKLALLDFNFAMAGLSTTIMRSLHPVMKIGINMLNTISDWIKRNEVNITRFIGVVAASITTVLIPAFLKMAKAVLLNPMTYVIAAFVALLLVIDDLVTYMRGGKTAFGDFWAKFGTAEELCERVGKVWAWLKTVFETVKDVIGKMVLSAIHGIGQLLETCLELWNKFKMGESASKIWDSLARIFSSLWSIAGKLIDVVSSLWDKFEAGETAGSLIAASLELISLALEGITVAIEWLADNWDNIPQMALNAVQKLQDVWQNFKDWLAEKAQSILDSLNIWSGIDESLNNAIQSMQDIWNSFKDWLFSLWDSIVEKISACIDMILAPIETVKNGAKMIAEKLGFSSEENAEAEKTLTEKRQEAISKPASEWTADDIAALSTDVSSISVATNQETQAKIPAPTAEESTGIKGWFSGLFSPKSENVIPSTAQLTSAPQNLSNISSQYDNSMTTTDNSSRTTVYNNQSITIEAQNAEDIVNATQQFSAMGYNISAADGAVI